MTSIDTRCDFIVIQKQLRENPNFTYPTVMPFGSHKIVEMTAAQRWRLYERFSM